MRVLIVDDHEPVRRGIRSLLARRPDWSVCGEAADGLEAVEKARELRPDVILMDMSMPRMDGAEATRIIRKDVPEAEVIIVTQNDPNVVRQSAAQIGARGYVSKVTLARDLLPAILDIIDGPGEQKPLTTAKEKPARDQWLFGGGDLGHLIREHDWSQTPLGPLDTWPASLRTAANLMLNSQHPMWIGWGREMTFLYNDAYISVLSLAKHPGSLGRPAREVWSEIWNLCGPLATAVFTKGEPSFANDVRLYMSRGEYFEETYYSFSYSPIYDESGNVAGLFCPSAETTDKVLHTRRLRTLSELSAKSLVEKSGDAACFSSLAIISQNPDDIPFCLLYLLDGERTVASLKGVAHVPADNEGISPAEIRLAEDASSQIWPLREVLESAQPQLVNLEAVASLSSAPSGFAVEEALVLPVTSPGQNRPIGVLIAGVNPTRKLDTEYRTFFVLIADQVGAAVQNATAVEQEKKRADVLAEVDRVKTEFFSNVSHEFRTPLTLMLAPLEDTLAKDGALSPEDRQRLQLAHRNSLRLLKLVNTLLDFSRIEAGRIQAVYEPTDLGTITTELASMFQSAADRAGLRLRIHCPPIDEPVYVDREMWEKIVFNLLSNAFKFTFAGEIEVSLEKSAGAVKLSVRDTGTGIPEHEMQHLFERFYRVKGAQGRTFEGSGIGLSLVQELARQHGGSVRVKSAVNRGSTFTVSIPLGTTHLPPERLGTARTLESTALRGDAYVQEVLRWLPGNTLMPEELPESAILTAAPLPRPQQSSEVRPRVLLADDNADMREYVQRLLQDSYEVVAVPDGEAALASARARRPDLVLSDVMMPRLDGFALLQAIRGNEFLRDIPVIMLSARAGEESRIEGIQFGADDYLVKPFAARELFARVQTHLELARIRKQSEETLRQHQNRIELVAQASQVGFWFCDLPFDKLNWDKRVKEHFWLPADSDVTIDTFYERLHPDDRERTREAVAQSIDTDTLYDIEYRTVAPYGGIKWIRAIGRPFYDPSGRPRRFDGLTLDITERKQAEERERQISAGAIAANAKFRAVFEQTTQFAGIMENDGMFIDANRLCLDACGYRAEEVLGRPFWQTAWWRNFPESQEKIRMGTKLAAEGIPYREILHYSLADGTERLVDFRLYPIVDDSGTVLFLHPTGIDITDLKRAEENYRNLAQSLNAEVRLRTRELEQRNADVLRQSDQLRDLSQRLLQAQDEERRRIARELHDSAGQTLTVLGMNLAQLAQDAQAAAPELGKSAEESQALVQHLHREIRTTSYLLHPPLLDETGLVSALNWYVQGLRERSGLDIALDIADDFGRLPRDMELVIFRLVQECLTNIHRHSGSKTARIRVARTSEGISVEVHDQGKGMPPEKLSEIQSGGSGVGIRGMRERLRQFGSILNIHSDSSGTQILVAIPVAKTAAAAQ